MVLCEVVSNERCSIPLRSDADSVHSLQLPEILLRQPRRLYGEHSHHVSCPHCEETSLWYLSHTFFDRLLLCPLRRCALS